MMRVAPVIAIMIGIAAIPPAPASGEGGQQAEAAVRPGELKLEAIVDEVTSQISA